MFLVKCVSQLHLVPNYECHLKTCDNQTLTCDLKLGPHFFFVADGGQWPATCVFFCRLCQPETYDPRLCTLFVACDRLTVNCYYKHNVFYLKAVSTRHRPVNSDCVPFVQTCHTDSDLLSQIFLFFCSNSTTLTSAKLVHFWANRRWRRRERRLVSLRGREPQGADRAPGTILADRTTLTKFRYPNCEYWIWNNQRQHFHITYTRCAIGFCKS